MLKKTIVITCLLSISLSANAALVDNGDYTSDTLSGLDWLDLSFTNNMSYDNVVSETTTGGMFSGWNIATSAQLYELFNNAGGDGYYSDTNNSIVLNTLYPLWGQMSYTGNDSWFHYLDVTPGDNTSGMVIENSSNIINYVDSFTSAPNSYFNIGTALVRLSEVPVPAAVWLFGSALLGLTGLKRKKLKLNKIFI